MRAVFKGCLLSVFLLCSSVATIQAAGVVFSEIMYHPVDSTNAPTDGDEYEFIELFNAGSTSVNLNGANFSSGISFTFSSSHILAPGSYRVLVKNQTAFTNRYPTAAGLVWSNYTGSLANSGEKVTLKTSGGVTLFSVSYGTANGWPEWPDGKGCSLVLRDPNGPADASSNWCASADFNGTPGTNGACHSADIVINEVLTHTDPPLEDAIELRNVTALPIDVTGWYLSDDTVIRKKYCLTNGVIPAGGHTVVYEYQFNAATPVSNNIPFSLNSYMGDQLYLTAATGAGKLTRQVDCVSFEAAENGVSFGRFPDGAAGELTTMDRLTFGTTNPLSLAIFRSGRGAPNSLPKVGPLVISEIMYHTPDDGPENEFIELLNISTNTVSLFDPLAPTNTWRLSHAVAFTFPTNLTLAAGAHLLVTGATNAGLFRATHQVPAEVAIFGPWTGRLDNAGESVRLYKPDPPNAGDGFVPYILVDRVDYDDSPPWPAAPDGAGPSLERIAHSSFGNTATSWFTGAPGGSAGTAPVGGFVNPVVSPSSPASGQSATVTVSIVTRGAPPTNVVLYTAINSTESTLTMVDDGTGADSVTGDQVYTAVVGGQPNGTWVHYRFQASCTEGTFLLPVPEAEFIPSPSITLRMSGGGVLRTEQPEPAWQTYSYSGIATHTNTFFFYLNGIGEALIDDVTFTAGAVQRVADSGFNNPLGSIWRTNGNHQTSFREWLPSENTYVCHILSTGAGNGTGSNISIRVVPPVATGDVCQVTFRIREATRSVQNWLSYLAGSAPAEVFISEIMYHPDAEDEAPLEYVELHNPSAELVNLGGWRLAGTGFTLPAGSLLPAGGYVVLCGSSAGMLAAYGITNTIGNWPGLLKNSGETLRLRNPYGRVVDEASYDDREPWPTAADGYGPSLERLFPPRNGNESTSWTSSAANNDWQPLVWTQLLSTAELPLSLWLDFDGKCHIDDVTVRPPGENTNLLANGLFDNGTNGWVMSGNHNLSRIKSNLGTMGSTGLVVACNVMRLVTGGYETLLYGDGVSNSVNTYVTGIMTGSVYEISLRARRVGLGGRLLVATGPETNSLSFLTKGTPGRPSSAVAVTNQIGFIWVQPDFRTCPVNTGNTIRALLEPAGGATAVHLLHRAFGTNGYDYCDGFYVTNAMRDDGVAPDTVASDGIYATTLPPFPGNWTFVRYRVEAETPDRFRISSPRPDDPDTDYAFWVTSASPQTHLPNWHILVDGDPMMYPDTRRACAVSPDGQTFTDVQIRHRGYPQASSNAAFNLFVHRGNPLDTWYANNCDSTIFRHRGLSFSRYYRRILNEPLCYQLQRELGYPSPRLRHVCIWINGRPTITIELEDPEDPFLEGNGIDTADFVSKNSKTGLDTVGGDPLINNLSYVNSLMYSVADADTEAAVRENIWYEAVQQMIAFLSAVSGADQSFADNMFQHRRAYDGRWWHYPWDWDISFTLLHTNLHPYYSTDDFQPFYSPSPEGNTLSQTLFHPSNSVYTLPYRHRQQMSLWRFHATILTTNHLMPKVDTIVQNLKPAFDQLGSGFDLLTNQAATIRQFILDRRDFLVNGDWPGKNPAIWIPGTVYNPSNVVISELMATPYQGGEYLELFNSGTQAIDLSQWRLDISNETYRIPFGTMLAPGSRLVIADRPSELTNTYPALAAAGFIQRCSGAPLWDDPLAWLTESEYATRIVELPKLTLPASGASIELRDLRDHLIDIVHYGASTHWPTNTGIAMELIDPRCDNNRGDVWSASPAGGTPSFLNAAAYDYDGDNLADDIERQLLAASGGSLTNIQQVRPEDDFDGDGISNLKEFIGGSDPIIPDAYLWNLDISPAPGNAMAVGFQTFAPDDDGYEIYSARRYRLEQVTSLLTTNWGQVPGLPEWNGLTTRFIYTNATPSTPLFFRFRTHLEPK